MTDGTEQGAEAYLNKKEAMSGVPRAIETGYTAREIQQAAYECHRKIESGEQRPRIEFDP